MTIPLTLALLAAATVPALRAENLTIPTARRTVSELAQGAAPFQRIEENRAAYRGWQRSMIPVVVSQVLDVSSSYGMRELNPFLADSSGRFGARAAGIKIGASTGLLAMEYLIVRRHPGAARVFSKLNWAGAIVTSSFAVHNYSIR